MTYLEKLEKRWNDLAGKPKTKEEIDEVIELAEKIEIEGAKEISDLLDELKQKGLKVNSIWDLVNIKTPYPEAIDILIKHLPKDYHDKNKEGIVRALTTKEAKGKAAEPLIEEYEKTPKEKSNLRWVIGNAIATTMTSKNLDWVISAVLDKSNGKSRGQLIKALRTSKSPQAKEALNKVSQENN